MLRDRTMSTQLDQAVRGNINTDNDLDGSVAEFMLLFSLPSLPTGMKYCQMAPQAQTLDSIIIICCQLNSSTGSPSLDTHLDSIMTIYMLSSKNPKGILVSYILEIMLSILSLHYCYYKNASS